jgi:hypothetical protein
MSGTLRGLRCLLITPGRDRTCNLRIRSPLLYPIELRALCAMFYGVLLILGGSLILLLYTRQYTRYIERTKRHPVVHGDRVYVHHPRF